MRQPAVGSVFLSVLILALFLAGPAAATPPSTHGVAGDDKAFPEPGVTLRGRVTDAQGRPVAGADVWLLEDPEERPRPGTDPAANSAAPTSDAERPAAVTGPDGRFVLRGLPPRQPVDLQVCREGYEPGGIWLKAPAAEPVRTVLARASYLSGRVVDEARQPVNEAQVEARIPGVVLLESRAAAGPCRKAGSSARAVTGKDGSFRLGPLSAGPFAVTAGREGFLESRSELQDVHAGRSVEALEIVIRRGADLEGQVLAPDGAPLEGIRVQVIRDGQPPTVAHTDPNGRLRMAGLEPGDWLVEATDPMDPGAEPERRSVRIEPGKNWTELTLRRRERQAVRGQVVGPDGRGLEGAMVRADWLGARTFVGPEVPAASTRTDGSFTLEIPDGNYRLSARKEGYARGELPGSLMVDGNEGSRGGVEIRLSLGGALAGQVRGLKAEERARVAVSTFDGDRNVSTSVDAEGRYRLEGLTPGSLVVAARAGSKLLEREVSLEPGQMEATLDLTFPSTSPVSGRLTGEKGEPVARGRIELRTNEGASRHVSVQSLSDGTFTADLEDGTYILKAQARGYSPTTLPQPVRIAGAPVPGIEVVLPRAVVIRGRISGLEPGTRIESVYAEGPAGYRSGHGVPDAPEGSYRILDAGPGEWKVTAIHGGRRVIGRVTVPPGAEEVVLDLDLPTGHRTIAGQILGLEDPRTFHVELFRPGQPDPLNGYISGEGQFRLRWLDDGLYELKVVRQGQVWHEQTVMLSADQELVIDLTGASP